MTETESTAVELREALAEAVVKNRSAIGTSVSDRILEAVRTVPRHLFVPGASLEEAYDNSASPIMKRDENGTPLSSVSAPWLQAAMLEQAQIEPGMRVLEIGSGGYNAALISELVGKKGRVVTLDIDPEACERATQGLDAAGYDEVVVVCADGEYGAAEYGPFDRIIVTVSAPDIPPAWTEQLAANGRLVVPLRLRGLARSFVFVPDGNTLRCTEFELCGFVPIQGAAEARQRLVSLDAEHVALRVDDHQPVEAVCLRRALESDRVDQWSGVTVGGMVAWDDLDMYLATRLHSYGYLTASDEGIASGRVNLALRWGMSATWDRDSLAYLAMRPIDEERTQFEFGAHGHGPRGAVLAQRLVHHVRSWDRGFRHHRPHFEVHPKDTLDGDLPPGLVVEKPHSRVTVSWPQS
ncbi:methyltransferase, FxLD system [Natronoglycomyces albus]|uniref:Protein-L-isoaspartate O-methyltransferase n=1 Tax=Natronoglycomyces albus TaxID=2811108 RepID=A0A895XW48_9ACTN|nr:methyltransferase, FxLD system [Natronoglycomyces albus]QSB06450.1 methyltransferase, FxLD system [Natronoglycomyces albus]